MIFSISSFIWRSFHSNEWRACPKIIKLLECRTRTRTRIIFSRKSSKAALGKTLLDQKSSHPSHVSFIHFFPFTFHLLPPLWWCSFIACFQFSIQLFCLFSLGVETNKVEASTSEAFLSDFETISMLLASSRTNWRFWDTAHKLNKRQQIELPI